MRTVIVKFIKKEFILSSYLILLILLAILYPEKITEYPSFIDWKTIIALSGLLIIVTGLKESGYFYLISRRLLKNIKTERNLSLLMIILSTILSTFLTNDVTLFIVVPLTISIQNLIKNDVKKLIIFEAISVNIGSTLTPIGNPQNLFLWHNWGISFIDFIVATLPLVVILLGVLLTFAWFVFPKEKIEFFEGENQDKSIKEQDDLFILSLTFLIIYIFSLESGYAYLILLLVIIIYFLFYRKILLNADWLLLLLFTIIFIDFHVLATLPNISKTVGFLKLHSSGNVFLFSAFVSQIFSNVPASVFVSKFTHDWKAIIYGVNVGGNGLVISSLANVIALRMTNSRKIWLDFHKYSIPYFIISGGIAYVLFYILNL